MQHGIALLHPFTPSSLCSFNVSGTRWYHVVASYDGTDNAAFIDGEEVARGTPEAPLETVAGAIIMGGNPNLPNASPFTGEVAQFGVWNRALSASEVAALYAIGPDTSVLDPALDPFASWTCSLCPAGTADSDGDPSTACEICAPGTYAAEAGRTVPCEACPDGQVQPAPAQTACISCGPGFFDEHSQDEDDGSCSTAKPCPNDRFCNFDNGDSGFCEACADCGGPDVDMCNACGLPNAGADDCVSACQHGSSSEICTACSAGQFSDTADQTNCTACEAGQVQHFPGQTSCSICGAGMVDSLYTPATALQDGAPCSAISNHVVDYRRLRHIYGRA